jgi:D-glycero-D-manno-heptose 1,7-bisphosphate phosphatase
MKRKAVFLDRDGVLNYAMYRDGKAYPPASLAELSIPADAALALTRLKENGYLLIGATNQPDVARGSTTKAIVEQINQRLMQALPLDAIKTCYHDNLDYCACRKPLPGMLLEAALTHSIDLSKSYMIGDRDKDIEAGLNAGCKTILIRYDHTMPMVDTAHYQVTTLTQAADWILSQS